jgi:hypothetical protein
MIRETRDRARSLGTAVLRSCAERQHRSPGSLPCAGGRKGHGALRSCDDPLLAHHGRAQPRQALAGDQEQARKSRAGRCRSPRARIVTRSARPPRPAQAERWSVLPVLFPRRDSAYFCCCSMILVAVFCSSSTSFRNSLRSESRASRRLVRAGLASRDF